MGLNISTINSGQSASAFINQQYSGECDINCTNTMNNVDVNIRNSYIGGNVDISQACSVNGQCLFSTNMDAAADLIFKGTNSSSAQATSAWLGQFGNIDNANINSYQNLSENINQVISQHCNISSSNNMNNIDVFAQGSYIGGDIDVSQYGNVRGGCALNTTMNASAIASGTQDNCAAAGKKAKKTCGGKGGKSPVTLGLILAIVIILIIGFVIVSRYFGKK